MKFYVILAAALLCSSIAFPQRVYKILGSVADAESKIPLPGVNVTALLPKDSTALTGAATDDKGKFMLEDITEKNIRLKISMIGYQSVSADVSLKNGSVDMGVIEIKQAVYELNEAIVKAVKPMVEYDAEKQIVNIDRTPESGGSITDALRSSGAVNVDPVTNKISLRGGSDTKILIDGKPAQMNEQTLASLPASSIDKVEITANPSAKDDPEGDSGIINLITKKEGLGDFSGSTSFSLSTKKNKNGSVWLNYKMNKLSLFGNFSGYYGEAHRSTAGRTVNYLGSSKYLLTSGSNNDVDGRYFNGKLGLDYEIDTMNQISFSGASSNMDYDWTIKGDNNYYTREKDWNDSSYNQISGGNNLRNEYSFSGFYKKKFNTKGHELSVDAYYASLRFKNNNDYAARYYYNPDLPGLQRNGTVTDNITFIYKTDYVYPSSYGKVEAGYNFTFRDRTNDYSSLDYIYAEAAWLDTMNLSNKFNYKEGIHAIYAIYSNSIGRFDYKAGLRVEQAYSRGKQRTTGSSFSTDYLSLYPSLSLIYKLWNNFPVSANFSRRIRRPQMEVINPFVKRTSPYSVEVGNPEIKPTYIYLYDLNFERLLKLYYTTAEGSPGQAKIINPDGTETVTTVNMASDKTYGAEASLTYISGGNGMPFKLPDYISMISLYVTYYRYEREGFYQSGPYITNLSGKSDNWLINTGVTLNMWYDVSGMFYAFYRPEDNDTRNRTNARSAVNIIFSKTFMDRKLRVNLAFYDALNTNKSYSNEEFGDTYYGYSKTTNSIGRAVGLSVTYSFNNYKPNRERNINDGRDAGGAPPGGM